MAEERFERIVEQAGKFRDHLVGKRIEGVEATPTGLLISLDDGSHLRLQAESGMGGDANWYNWFSVRVPGVGEIQFE